MNWQTSKKGGKYIQQYFFLVICFKYLHFVRVQISENPLELFQTQDRLLFQLLLYQEQHLYLSLTLCLSRSVSLPLFISPFVLFPLSCSLFLFVYSVLALFPLASYFSSFLVYHLIVLHQIYNIFLFSFCIFFSIFLGQNFLTCAFFHSI